jgi:hypothetical protein
MNVTYECAYARNHRLLMNVECATNDECVQFVEYHAKRVYDASRVEIECYTDELHVFVRRHNSSRRDFVASYHAT